MLSTLDTVNAPPSSRLSAFTCNKHDRHPNRRRRIRHSALQLEMLGLHAADLATLMHVQHGMYLASWHAQTCDSPLLKVTNTVDISALSLESEDGTKDVCNYMQRLLGDMVTNLTELCASR